MSTVKQRKPVRQAHQFLLVGVGIALTILVLVIPLVLIFAKAFAGGWQLLLANLQEDYLCNALALTVFTTLLTVPCNLLFGILLAWCVTHYRFRGRGLLLTLVDIPYATSPVVAGLCYLVVFGMESILGQWFSAHDIQLMFAWPGIVMVTIFVTTTYIARILIPLMQVQGSEEELAALSLGASGWTIF